jgi:hypothetical protein
MARKVTICDYSRPPYPFCQTYENVATAVPPFNAPQSADEKYSLQIERLTKQQLDKIMEVLGSNIKAPE